MARSGSARTHQSGLGKLRLQMSIETVWRFRSQYKPESARPQMTVDAPDMLSDAPQFASPQIQLAGLSHLPELAKLMAGIRFRPNSGRVPPVGHGSRGLPGPHSEKRADGAASQRLGARCGREANPRRWRARLCDLRSLAKETGLPKNLSGRRTLVLWRHCVPFRNSSSGTQWAYNCRLARR